MSPWTIGNWDRPNAIDQMRSTKWGSTKWGSTKLYRANLKISVKCPFKQLHFDERTVFQNNLQWLLELMGQIRSVLRSSEIVEKTEEELVQYADSNTAGGFHLLFDILTLAVILSSDIDAALPSFVDNFLQTSAWRERLKLLPSATHALVSRYNEFGTQFAEWMTLILNDASFNVSKVHKSAIKKSLSGFKEAGKYDEGSVWGKLVLNSTTL